jgi:hypothetical protein
MPLGKKLQLRRFGVDEYHIGIATTARVERLTGALSDDLDGNPGLPLEQR